MEQNTNETITGEFTDQEEAPIKKKFVITPKLKKALVIGGTVVSVIATIAVITNTRVKEAIEDDSIEIKMVTEPDGTETLTISEVHTTEVTHEAN